MTANSRLLVAHWMGVDGLVHRFSDCQSMFVGSGGLVQGSLVGLPQYCAVSRNVGGCTTPFPMVGWAPPSGLSIVGSMGVPS